MSDRFLEKQHLSYTLEKPSSQKYGIVMHNFFLVVWKAKSLLQVLFELIAARHNVWHVSFFLSSVHLTSFPRCIELLSIKMALLNETNSKLKNCFKLSRDKFGFLLSDNQKEINKNYETNKLQIWVICARLTKIPTMFFHLKYSFRFILIS